MEQKTYKDLKDFLETLSDEQLQQTVVIDWVDSHSTRDVLFGVVDEDIYMYDDDAEDIGTLTELKSIHEEEYDYDESKLALVTQKGAVFISCD